MKQLFILLFIVLAISLLTIPSRAGAISECQSERKGYCVRLDPQAPSQPIKRGPASFLFAAVVPFPGLEFLSGYGIGYNTPIGVTLSALYNFGVSVAGISALIMLTYAGILRVTAISPSMISEGNRKITGALLGLALIATSYLILYTINHDFTLTLSDKTIPSIKGLMPETPPPPAEPPPVDPGF